MSGPPPSPSAPPGGPPPGIPLLTPPPIPGIVQLKKDLTASIDYLVAFTAIMIWDVISTFPSEFRYVWKHEWCLLKVVFFLNRYGSLVLQIMNMSLVVAKVSSQFCSNFFWFTPFVGTYVLTICGVIFALHVYKLYEQNCNIGGILVGCVCALVATMASNGAQFTHVDFSPAAQQFLDFYGCVASGKPGKSMAPTILFWTAPFVFNLVMLSLALWHSFKTTKGATTNGKKVSIVQALLNDGIWYLSVATLVNLVSVILASQTANPNLHNFNAAGSISLNFVMANRLLISNFHHKATLANSIPPGSRDVVPAPHRLNPNFPSNNFAISSCLSNPAQHLPHSPSSYRHRSRRDDVDLDSDGEEEGEHEKYERDFDLEARGGGEGSEGGGGIEMERKYSEATLAGEDNRSIKSKVSEVGTFEIGVATRGQRGIEEEIEASRRGGGGNEKEGGSETLGGRL